MANNQMPHNLEAEAAILGCIIIDGDIQSELLETLKEDDFYQESNRLVYDAMKKVYAARKPVDVVTLTDMLERDGTLERAGGLQRITELAEVTPSSANYKQYFEIVRRDAIRRSLIRAAKGIIEVSTEGGEARDAVAYAEKQVYDISKQEDNSQLGRFSASSRTFSPTRTRSADWRRDSSTWIALQTACRSRTSSSLRRVPAWERRRSP